MSYSITLSGHGKNPVSASCYYSLANGTSKSASYSGTVREAGEQAIAFIESCQAEDEAAQATVVKQADKAELAGE